MPRTFENREARAGDPLMKRLRHRDWRRVILLTHENGRRHSEARQRCPFIGSSEHPASLGISLHIVAQKYVDTLLDDIRMTLPKGIAKPARGLKADQ